MAERDVVARLNRAEALLTSERRKNQQLREWIAAANDQGLVYTRMGWMWRLTDGTLAPLPWPRPNGGPRLVWDVLATEEQHEAAMVEAQSWQ